MNCLAVAFFHDGYHDTVTVAILPQDEIVLDGQDCKRQNFFGLKEELDCKNDNKPCLEAYQFICGQKVSAQHTKIQWEQLTIALLNPVCSILLAFLQCILKGWIGGRVA